MSFTVNDFADFMDVLRAHPEWQADLRRILVDDDPAELREAVLEQQRRTDERFDQLGAGLDALTARVEALTEEVRAFARATDARFQRVDDDLGQAQGLVTGELVQRARLRIFGHFLDRVRVVSFAEVKEVKAAFRSGALSKDRWDDLRGLDLLVSGVDDEGSPVLIAEVSSTLDAHDVERAARRAAIIQTVGLRAIPAVGGGTVSATVADEARDRGVGVLVEGDFIFWPQSAA